MFEAYQTSFWKLWTKILLMKYEKETLKIWRIEFFFKYQWHVKNNRKYHKIFEEIVWPSIIICMNELFIFVIYYERTHFLLKYCRFFSCSNVRWILYKGLFNNLYLSLFWMQHKNIWILHSSIIFKRYHHFHKRSCN